LEIEVKVQTLAHMTKSLHTAYFSSPRLKIAVNRIAGIAGEFKGGATYRKLRNLVLNLFHIEHTGSSEATVQGIYCFVERVYFARVTKVNNDKD
jgi:hypothetical protein